ncbi:hypothetical protein FRB96_001720 [Tulasnella sp. 330]|nr:hypothetical protein FRB96_001720 [Tulasnella sp. 330]KAG8882350.1 hypothetical protein FRB97_008364 [Tulasnella sp. 331]KAG8886817.1 hypothetical protein FRB98_000953 [Tulasnella sp. 332]
MVRNTNPQSHQSGPGGYPINYAPPNPNIFQPSQVVGSSNGWSGSAISSGSATSIPTVPTVYLPGGIPKAQVYARRATPVQAPNQSPTMFATRRSSSTTTSAPTYATPSYARSNRIIPAQSAFPVFLESGVYVARAAVDLPYRLFYIQTKVVDGEVATILYAALDRQLLDASTTDIDWFTIVGALEPYAQMIQAFSYPSGGWRFLDAREGTGSYNQSRLRRETPFLELLVGRKVDETRTEWMVPARELAN